MIGSQGSSVTPDAVRPKFSTGTSVPKAADVPVLTITGSRKAKPAAVLNHRVSTGTAEEVPVAPRCVCVRAHVTLFGTMPSDAQKRVTTTIRLFVPLNNWRKPDWAATAATVTF